MTKVCKESNNIQNSPYVRIEEGEQMCYNREDDYKNRYE